MAISGGTWAGAITTANAISTGILMNGATNAHSQSVSGGVVSEFAGITTTIANLDATAGASGFGGNAFIPTGAKLANAL